MIICFVIGIMFLDFCKLVFIKTYGFQTQGFATVPGSKNISRTTTKTSTKVILPKANITDKRTTSSFSSLSEADTS